MRLYNIIMKKIIIIEGCDGQGKSFLANQIMEKYRNHVYIHNAVTNDIPSLHHNTITTALMAAHEHEVVIDRLHLSEHIYGTIFRNGPTYNVKQFDDNLNNMEDISFIKILCKIDKETSMNIHDSRLEVEMFNDVTKAYDMYDTIIDDLKLDGWIVYNWKTDNLNLDTFELTKKEIING